MGLSIPLRISKVTKNKILLNFDWNHLKLFGTGEKLPKDSGNFFRQISVKNIILMDEKHEWQCLTDEHTVDDADDAVDY